MRCRALLAEAGLEDGFQTEIWAMPVQRPYNPNARRMAEHRTLLLGWVGQNGDPDNMLSPLLSCNAKFDGGLNRARRCDPDFDSVLADARETTDRPERIEFYARAQEIFQSQVPWVAIAHADILEAVGTEVLNYHGDPFGRHIFYPVALGAGGE